MEKPPFVGARLRLGRDADIIKALEKVEQGDVSDLIRKGLRLALNLVKQPQIGILEDVKQSAESATGQQKNQPEKLVWKL